jgi:hypothetical protein
MIAALVAALIGSAIYLGFNDRLTPRTLLGLMLAAGLPISLALTGLAGPPLARLIVGRHALDWPGAALLGIAVAVVPATIILLAVVPLRVSIGEPMELRGWLGGLGVLAVSGCIGGLTFRWLHGRRPIQ